MRLLLDPQGNATCLYGEVIELEALGEVHIRRASSVEPDQTGKWWADMMPVRGPLLGPFGRRSEALAAEVRWLEENRL